MAEFWTAVRQQLAELREAKSDDDVCRILSHERNPYGTGERMSAGPAFFAGSGGDGTVREALTAAGWSVVWSEASYYYAMKAPDGSVITYTEGDIDRGDLKAPPAEPTAWQKWRDAWTWEPWGGQEPDGATSGRAFVDGTISPPGHFREMDAWSNGYRWVWVSPDDRVILTHVEGDVIYAEYETDDAYRAAYRKCVKFYKDH